jgi:hypothetical protein
MSALQDRAKNILTLMMNEQNVTINADGQYLLAQWATMTAMTSEFSHVPTMAVTREQREKFKADMRPPDGWYIFVGRYKGLEWDTRFRHVGAKSFNPSLRVKAPEANNSFSTTFVVKALTIYVVGSTDLGFFNNPAAFTKDFANAFNLRPVWPTVASDEIVWMDVRVNYDNDLAELSNWITKLPSAPLPTE